MDIKCSKKIQSDYILKITVGIPAFNEEKNIAKIISQIKEITLLSSFAMMLLLITQIKLCNL